MAENAGFLEQLTGTAVDERAQVDAKLQEDAGTGGRLGAMFNSLGQQAGAGLGIAGAGLMSGLSGGRFGGTKGAGFKSNFASAAEEAETKFVAAGVGIQPEELQARRAIREQLADMPDDGTHQSRIKMAERAIEISNSFGDAAGVARGLEQLQALKKEKLEFDKLGSQAKKAEADATEAGIVNGYNSDGTPATGILGIKDGSAGIFTEENGKLTHKAFNKGFSMVEPGDTVGIKPFEIASQIKKNNGVAYVGKIKGLASSANTALAKTDRVLSTLTDLFDEGGVESVIGFSGGLITGVDNLVRNVSGTINAFAGPGQAIDSKAGTNKDGSVRTFDGRSGLAKFAADASNSFSSLIQLPAGVERTSAAAQQHRAAVMEMAYMAARLAEPSNRGLSDNDIKNALARIAGDTSNPQVMMRRFLEMQVDAANELDFELRLSHGSLGANVSDDAINTALVGKGYGEYKARKDALFEKFNVTEQQDGRVTFAEGTLIGSDVQPGEGTGPVQQPVDIDTATDAEVLAGFGFGTDKVKEEE